MSDGPESPAELNPAIDDYPAKRGQARLTAAARGVRSPYGLEQDARPLMDAADDLRAKGYVVSWNITPGVLGGTTTEVVGRPDIDRQTPFRESDRELLRTLLAEITTPDQWMQQKQLAILDKMADLKQHATHGDEFWIRMERLLSHRLDTLEAAVGIAGANGTKRFTNLDRGVENILYALQLAQYQREHDRARKGRKGKRKRV